MTTQAAFELGGAVLGTIEVQIAKGWASNSGCVGRNRWGFNSPPFPPISVRSDNFVARILLNHQHAFPVEGHC